MRRIGLALLVVLLLVVGGGAVSAAADPQTATISGHVDLETPTGIVDGEGVGVTLFFWFESMIDVYLPAQGNFGDVADENGDFEITGVEPGYYILAFGTSQWYQANTRYAGQYLGGGATPAAGLSFAVEEGQHVFVPTTTMVQESSLAGSLTDASGSRISNGRVVVYSGGEEDYSGALLTTITPGLDGEWSLSGLMPGEYRLGFAANSYGAMGLGNLAVSVAPFVSQWYRGGYEFADASIVVIPEPGDGVENLNSVLRTDPLLDAPEGGEYAALGDSFQSGEGSYDYFAGTDTETNECHRSVSAYPVLLRYSGLIDLDLNFRACSGAVIDDLEVTFSTERAPWDDGISQLDALGEQTGLVTIGIGGNDLGFSRVVEACAHLVVSKTTCERELGPDVAASLASLQSGAMRTKLDELLGYIRDRAPNARLLLISYPLFFPNPLEPEPFGCTGMVLRQYDRLWMNQSIYDADRTLASIAGSAGFEFVDMWDALDGHEQCTEDPGLNAIMNFGQDPESYHPNAYGHELMAQRLIDYLDHRRTPAAIVGPAEIASNEYEIGGESVTFTIKWPAGEVTSQLISPSEEVYSAATPLDATHESGPTWESFSIDDPEPGIWTVVTQGVDVVEYGELIDILVSDVATPNVAPTAAIFITDLGDRRFEFDGSAAVDTDGNIASYFWDFGDGETATGAVVEHTFATFGEFLPTVVVQDDDGGSGFATADDSIVIPRIPEPTVVNVPGDYTASDNTVIYGSIHTEGDFVCGEGSSVNGDLVVGGTITIGTYCSVSGSVWAGGTVTVEQWGNIAESVFSVGDVVFDPEGRIAGDVTTTGDFVPTDSSTIEDLHTSGQLGGDVNEGAAVTLPTEPLASSVVYDSGDWVGYDTIEWVDWINGLAAENDAPPGSAGLSSTPGCIVDSSVESVNANVIEFASPIVIDARSAVSGCSAVTFDDIDFDLNTNVVILADGFKFGDAWMAEASDQEIHDLALIVEGNRACTLTPDVAFHEDVVPSPFVRVLMDIAGQLELGEGAEVGGMARAGCVDGHDESQFGTRWYWLD